MGKKILFPFSPGKSFSAGYSWTMELAARMNAALFFFTTVPADEKNNIEFLHHVYHSLLEAQGSYLQHASHGLNPARTERHIGQGDFSGLLARFVKRTRFDIVVIDPCASVLPKTTLDYVVENSDGVIVLPSQPGNSYTRSSPSARESESRNTKVFYDVLHQSDVYKLQDNFFRTLSQDTGLFNYLRNFFRKN